MNTIPLARAQFVGIGTSIEIITHARTQLLADAQLERARNIARQRVEELDRAASRFRVDSELTMLQALHTGEWTLCSPILTRALHAALWAAEWTGGLIDPTLGQALRRIGYDRDLDEVQANPTPGREPAKHVARWRDVGVRLDERLVRLPRNANIDLGSTGKSWLAVVLAAEIHEVTGGGVLVNLGGDLAVCGEAPCGGWTVTIDDGRSGETVAIQHGAIATSSTQRRSWTSTTPAGVPTRKHHIIDPRSGDSAAVVWETVTVVADSCLTANAAATASIILGAQAPTWLAERRLHARLVSAAGDVVYVGEWPGATTVSRQAS
ncbi:FAD:protein FMN transferase [Micrococcales bacterium 31B]|nr:FAD:protein FMN transferase [Micrococcales bacterium 31B]